MLNSDKNKTDRQTDMNGMRRTEKTQNHILQNENAKAVLQSKSQIFDQIQIHLY